VAEEKFLFAAKLIYTPPHRTDATVERGQDKTHLSIHISVWERESV